MFVEAPKPFDFTKQMRQRRMENLESILNSNKKHKSSKKSPQTPNKSHQSKEDAIKGKSFKKPSDLVDHLKKTVGYQTQDYTLTDYQNLGAYLPNSVRKRNQATLKELSRDQIREAKLIKASHVMFDDDLADAQDYLDNNIETKGWEIDPALSTKDYLIVTKGKELRLVARGTEWSTTEQLLEGTKIGKTLNVGKPNISDMRANMSNLRGTTLDDPQTKSMIDALKSGIEKHNIVNTRQNVKLNGYSKGGAQMLHIGDQLGFETNLYNPFIHEHQIHSNSNTRHNIITTNEDIVSIRSHFANKPNWKVNRIRAIGGESGWNMLAQHRLSNFTQFGERQPSYLERNERLITQLAHEHANYDTLHMMKTGIENGETFTENMKNFGGMTEDDTYFGDMDVDDNPIVKLRDRAAYGSPHVEAWERMGGNFTASEHNHLNNTPSSNPQPTPPDILEVAGRSLHEFTPEEVTRFGSKTHEERVAHLDDIKQQMDTAGENTMKEATKISNGISDIVSPSELGKGMIAGFVGDKAVDTMDPDHKLDKVLPDGDTLAKGAASAEAGAVMFAGRVASAPELGGAMLGIEAGKHAAELTDVGLKAAGVKNRMSEELLTRVLVGLWE